jgi:hypothetical protein
MRLNFKLHCKVSSPAALVLEQEISNFLLLFRLTSSFLSDSFQERNVCLETI